MITTSALLVIISCVHIQANHITPTPSYECSIQNVWGFLQRVCSWPQSSSNTTVAQGLKPVFMKCLRTEQFFRVSFKAHGRSARTSVDVLCEDDPIFYQACASLAVFPRSHHVARHEPKTDYTPCGYFCNETVSFWKKGIIVSSLDFGHNGVNVENYANFACDGEASCSNTNLDESLCKNVTTHMFKPDMQNEIFCDLVCDLKECEDESTCNGFNYGLWCDNHEHYRPPNKICYYDGQYCIDGADDALCEIGQVQGPMSLCHKHYVGENVSVPLYNFTRCSAIVRRTRLAMTAFIMVMEVLCDDFLDQTNCTDDARVGLHCSIRGFMSTVAHQIVCINRSYLTEIPSIPTLCDDGLDKACMSPSGSCEVHKHRMCDGLIDCKDRSDETHEICQDMTDKTCMRGYVFERHERRSAIPINWVHDGMTDCMGNEDEAVTWPQCGRFKNAMNDSCDGVFLCDRTDEFIEISRLCDMIDSCGTENRICEISRARAFCPNCAPNGTVNLPIH